MAHATMPISRNLSRTRRRPHAISMGGACNAAPLLRLKLEVHHDFPLVQMSGDIVIEREAHQYDQQCYPHLLTKILRALRQGTSLDGFHQLINHLAAIEQRYRHQIEDAQAHADDREERGERRHPEIRTDTGKFRYADRT